MTRKPSDIRTDEPTITRRQLMGGAAAAAAFTIVPRHVLGGAGKTPPSEKIALAAIGLGDQGRRDMRSFLDRPAVRLVAVCDVDEGNRKAAQAHINKTYGNSDCTAFADYRELLAKQKDLDAVTVVTPDHTHAIISAAAMRAGKHVYCQKPFAHTVFEARTLGELTRQTKVATQLGVANQAGEGPRVLREMIEDGAIGGVREAHVWSNRPFWPQGIDRPPETPSVPPGLDWDLWLGPAPQRPYHPAYLPLVWRGWWDFGTGALGDMGCYALDTVFRALHLRCPTSVEGSGSGFAGKMWDKPRMSRETYPHASYITWQFPAREQMPPVTVTWYDGGLRPARPKDLHADRPLGEEGAYYVGEKGVILTSFTGDNPRLLPEERMKAYTMPPKRLPRSIGHHDEWLRACRGGEPAGANFEFSATVTEALLLGNVALRAGDRLLLWDAPALKVTNVPKANQYLHFEYRQGWKL